ncbi:unnamed protein product [Malus baccata var. baccata]
MNFFLSLPRSDTHSGISRVRWFGVEGDYNALVMDVMGINPVEFVHSKSFLHRDMKPNNFLIVASQQLREVFRFVCFFLFSLAKQYRDTSTHQHIPYRVVLSSRVYNAQKVRSGNLMQRIQASILTVALVITEFSLRLSIFPCLRYSSSPSPFVRLILSSFTFKFIEQSCRDDLESLGYVLMYFLFGSLPWQGVSASTGNARNDEEFERICEIKESTSIERCRAINHVSLYACFLASGYRRDFKYDWVLGQTRLLQSLKTLAGGEEDRLFHSLITGVEEGAYYIA